MITEDYVSFEIAKLLKERGFDESTNSQYPVYSIHYGEVGEYNITDRSRNPENYIPAPTLQMAMKWLRKEYSINPVPYALSLGWAFDVFDLSNRDITGCKKLYSMDFPSKSEVYSTYEEAAEAAIKYCLEKLI